MSGIYTKALAEVGYKASRFLQMLADHGGLETAQILLHSDGVSDGYIALSQSGRLDLTVEFLILDSEWDELFSEEERAIAKRRLEGYGQSFN